jgi:hypothetical protein
MTYPLSAQTQLAVTALMQCHAACAGAASIVLLEGDREQRPQHVRLFLDAAAITLATADALLRKSQFQSQFTSLCVAICETCLQDCEGKKDLLNCTQACRQAVRICTTLDVPEKAEILAMASRLPPN